MSTDPNAVVSVNLPQAPSGFLSNSHDMDPEAYWTAERMAAAQPFVLKDEEAPVPGDDVALPPSSGEPVVPEEGEPFVGLLELSQGLAPPFNAVPVANTGMFPYSAVGKLFARVNGVPQYGTAFVVGAHSIVTAGHCIFNDVARNWVDMVVFAPRYANGASMGLWKGVSLHTLAGWATQRPDARLFDVGGVMLDHPVSPGTGIIGWFANLPFAQGPFHSVGYPTQWVSPQFPFDGNHMWWCMGGQLPSSGLLRMANNMTTGASGGPWLIQRNGNIYVNGLNSFRLSNEPNVLASPYFGKGFVNLMARLTQ